MKHSTMNLITASAITIALAQSASPAVVAPASVTGVNGTPPTIDNTGTFVSAVNFGPSGDQSQDGITFTGAGASGNPTVINNGTLTYTISTSSSNSNADFGNDLWESEIWSTSGAAISMLIEGLDASKIYRVQFLHGDTRNINYNAGVLTFTDSSNNTANTTLSFGNPGDFALVSVEVSGSTSLQYDMPQASRGPSYSAVAVHVIPEPGSLALLALGGLTMLRRRRP